ncbi:ABC transporter substrate-binding protein, partial [Rhizobiaceae sp. 2RAB30]
VTTYLEIQSTVDDCCWAAGNEIWGELLELAGGRTLPGVTQPWFQKIQIEHLLSSAQDVYIASGGGWASGSRPPIGPGLDPVKGRHALRQLIGRTGFNQLASVRNRRVHGVWTGLITVPPLNILFLEIAAKWLHPDRCGEIDPEATLAAINRDFLAQPIDGPLWVSLQE